MPEELSSTGVLAVDQPLWMDGNTPDSQQHLIVFWMDQCPKRVRFGVGETALHAAECVSALLSSDDGPHNYMQSKESLFGVGYKAGAR